MRTAPSTIVEQDRKLALAHCDVLDAILATCAESASKRRAVACVADARRYAASIQDQRGAVLGHGHTLAQWSSMQFRAARRAVISAEAVS